MGKYHSGIIGEFEGTQEQWWAAAGGASNTCYSKAIKAINHPRRLKQNYRTAAKADRKWRL